MPDPTVAERVSVQVHLDRADWSQHLAEETRRGLSDRPPWIPPVWFYDEVGSALFERITRLVEYYPTRAERAILRARAADIARMTKATTLAELGSGTSEKTALLLDALEDVGTLERFAPFDCSEEVLRSASAQVAAERPGIRVDAVVGDFHEHLPRLPAGGTRLLAFLGSTIGNLDDVQRPAFLTEVCAALGTGDWFLLGTDLVKDPERLLAAYDDAAGVTAEFNLNALRVLNRQLGADFDLGSYHHRAHWDDAAHRIEMHLVADEPQRVRVAGLGDLELDLADGDWIRTEISTKFTAEGVAAELAAAGLDPVDCWSDPGGDFLLTLARPR
jgi:L-histidine N-alpha-methyltransferase